MKCVVAFASFAIVLALKSPRPLNNGDQVDRASASLEEAKSGEDGVLEPTTHHHHAAIGGPRAGASSTTSLERDAAQQPELVLIVRQFIEKIVSKYQNGGREEVRAALAMFDQPFGSDTQVTAAEEPPATDHDSCVRLIAVKNQQLEAATAERTRVESALHLEMAHREVAERRLKDAWYFFGGGMLKKKSQRKLEISFQKLQNRNCFNKTFVFH
jgi:hypothetical protein